MRTLITMLILFTSVSLYAPLKPPEANIDVFKMWHRDKLLNAIIYVESRGNTLAYNKREQSAGLIQIRPIMVRHINKISGSNYILEDRFDSLKSIAMFDSLMVKRNPDYDIQIACNIWNSGKLNPQGRAKRMVEVYTEEVYSRYNN